MSLFELLAKHGIEVPEEKKQGLETEFSESYREAQEFKELNTELEGVKGQLSQANEQIAGFKELDIEGVKQKSAEWEQKYNQAIKEAFRLAGLDRIVTIVNPLTRQPEQKFLYEVATTHTARKTFIGNMYKKVKDPDLVSSVSGHKEGSKAFRRYREIDDEMKQELVHLLD